MIGAVVITKCGVCDMATADASASIICEPFQMWLTIECEYCGSEARLALIGGGGVNWSKARRQPRGGHIASMPE